MSRCSSAYRINLYVTNKISIVRNTYKNKLFENVNPCVNLCKPRNTPKSVRFRIRDTLFFALLNVVNICIYVYILNVLNKIFDQHLNIFRSYSLNLV